MLKRVRSVIYAVDDIERAKAWYSEVLGFAPYFDDPHYVGFSVNGFELGRDPDAPKGQEQSVAYWEVDDIEAAMARLVALGAQERTPIIDVGGGTRLASVTDPFGNALGVIQEGQESGAEG